MLVAPVRVARVARRVVVAWRAAGSSAVQSRGEAGLHQVEAGDGAGFGALERVGGGAEDGEDAADAALLQALGEVEAVAPYAAHRVRRQQQAGHGILADAGM